MVWEEPNCLGDWDGVLNTEKRLVYNLRREFKNKTMYIYIYINIVYILYFIKWQYSY
jgi:hypothetical protein